MKNIARFLDFANHHANATHADIDNLCNDVLHYQFNAAFVNPLYVSYAQQKLQTKSKIGTVVSFPLGQEALAIKLESIRIATLCGVNEIDVSLNVASIKEAEWSILEQDMVAIVSCGTSINPHIIIKFIPETGYLSPYEIQKTAEIMVRSGAHFFKTCSGMGPRGATLEDVYLVRSTVGTALKIKVAGGISTYQKALSFIEAGADRIGTSSAVSIMTEAS